MGVPGILGDMGLTMADDLSFSPVLQDLKRWWQVFESTAQSYVDIHYSNDAAVAADVEIETWYQELGSAVAGVPTASKTSLVELSAACLWTASAFHEMVGLQDFKFANPYIISPAWRIPVNTCDHEEAPLEERISSVWQTLFSARLARALAVSSPTIRRDWSFMAEGLAKQEETEAVWEAFSQKMVDLDGEIAERNTGQQNQNVLLLSSEVHCSVAV